MRHLVREHRVGFVTAQHAQQRQAHEQAAAANLALLERFMDGHRELLTFVPPAGGTTCFPCLRVGPDARPLSAALAKAGVLVAPGDCFGAPSHLRIGFGAMREGYADALRVLGEVLARRGG